MWQQRAEEIRDTWQCRLLRGALWVDGEGCAHAADLMGAVVLSVLAHNYDEELQLMLRATFPTCHGIRVPFLKSAARIARTGEVMADMFDKNGYECLRQRLFRSTRDMEGKFRRLADRHRLFGRDRLAFFAAITNWVVADYRLDPNMARADPDARRLH